MREELLLCRTYESRHVTAEHTFTATWCKVRFRRPRKASRKGGFRTGDAADKLVSGKQDKGF